MPCEDPSPLLIPLLTVGITVGLGGVTSTPGLRSGRIIVNELTFLKGYVPLAAGWTEALVILIEKGKAKKRTVGRMQKAGDTMAGEKEEVGETACGPKGKR